MNWYQKHQIDLKFKDPEIEEIKFQIEMTQLHADRFKYDEWVKKIDGLVDQLNRRYLELNQEVK